MLSYLRTIFSVAMEWGVIDRPPAKIKKLKAATPKFSFYDFEEFDRLVLTAEMHANPSRLLAVLLGGEAGLRCGEILGLEWADIDMKLGILTVARSMYLGKEGPPKGGRSRTIPLAPRLRAALSEHRHLRGPHVLWTKRGTFPANTTIRSWLNQMQKTAAFEETGTHVLRHTFCSHLAMLGKPVRVIQELAGHQSITTTERYMHLAPAAARDAVEGLRRPANWRHAGDGHSAVINLQ